MATTKKPYTRRAKSTSTTGHYLTNKFLLEQISVSKAQGKPTDDLVKAFMLLAERSSRHRWYVRFSFKDELIQHAIVNLLFAWDKFDEKKYSNPFAYYTTCCMNSFSEIRRSEYNEALCKERISSAYGNNRQSYNRYSHDDHAFGAPE